MNYRELLNRCQKKPGWLGTREQKEAESQLKYRTWVMQQDEEYRKEVNKNKYNK